jgi:hypothetical protein
MAVRAIPCTVKNFKIIEERTTKIGYGFVPKPVNRKHHEAKHAPDKAPLELLQVLGPAKLLEKTKSQVDFLERLQYVALQVPIKFTKMMMGLVGISEEYSNTARLYIGDPKGKELGKMWESHSSVYYRAFYNLFRIQADGMGEHEFEDRCKVFDRVLSQMASAFVAGDVEENLERYASAGENSAIAGIFEHLASDKGKVEDFKKEYLLPYVDSPVDLEETKEKLVYDGKDLPWYVRPK